MANRLMEYNWQQEKWPSFPYLADALKAGILHFQEGSRHLSGILKGLPVAIRNEEIADSLVAEAISTSEIEGEFLSHTDVMSSIRNHMGLNTSPQIVHDRRASGVAEMLIQLRKEQLEPLNEEMIFAWHKSLMQGNQRISKGRWRTHKEAMRVISGSMNKTQIHFEAPPSNQVPHEMKKFVVWWNDSSPVTLNDRSDSVIRCAISHLYFESIHPFEDGNGRIGRALAEKALAEHIGGDCTISISKSILANKQEYYQALEMAQKSKDITKWLVYFVDLLNSALGQAEASIEFVLKKTRLLDAYKSRLNERQLKLILRMLRDGSEQFEGGVNAKKYCSLNKTSKATATRDLQQLKEMGLLRVVGQGRSTRYELILDGC